MNDFFDLIAKPDTFWITVNRKCNFRCKWCYAESSEYMFNDNMTLEKAKEIIELALDMNVHQVTIIGGEPTLWPYLLELNKYCKEVGVKVGMVTNACMFGDDIYWNRYIQSPCDTVGVSIKSVNKEQFSSLIDRASLFQQTIRGIKRAMDYYDNAGVSTVYSNLMSPNDIKEIAKVSKKLGSNYFTLSPCIATLSKNGPSGDYMVDPRKLAMEFMELYPYLDSLYEGRITFELSLPLCLWPKDFIDKLFEKNQAISTCHVQNRTGLIFDTNGDIMPCNGMMGVYIAQKDVDFHDADSLISHLNSEAMCNDYAELLRYPGLCCDVCTMKKRCRGGCIINWTILKPHDLCHSVI